MDDKLSQSSDFIHDNRTLSPSSSSSSSYVSKLAIIPTKLSIDQQQQQQHHSSNSSDSSEYDITNVSSISMLHQHPFQLQSMKHVLLGLSPSTSRSTSPTYSFHHQQQLNETNVSIKKNSHHHHYEQPFIHNNRNNHYRTRLTSSAINRQKQQQQIERENLKILQRLQQIRPSRSLKRDELLSDYDRQMNLITYTTDSRSRVPSRLSNTSFISSTSSVSEKNHHIQSRPLSATNLSNRNSLDFFSMSANSHSSSARKPLWNDRWQQEE
ncbi:unnamed protein product [Adineta steineri]|uniref:Uncharacterized protein n=1 Tax=Adineta steineri TaxID=433720 RepID=A0A818P3T1_9BILA|nr:unnamed protein product [Adineta steineri]CAF3613582.1 unnamed protein product [Adineta steineri]